MISNKDFYELKESISKETRIIKEINSLFSGFNSEDKEEKEMISSQINLLKNSLKKENVNVLKMLMNIYLTKPLPQTINKTRNFINESKPENKKLDNKSKKSSDDLRKESFKELNKKEKIIERKEKKPSKYVGFSNKIFSNFSIYLLKKGRFKTLQKNLVKASMRFLPKSYISVIFFSTILSLIIAIFMLAFFLFFNVSIISPFITMNSGGIIERFIKISWIFFF